MPNTETTIEYDGYTIKRKRDLPPEHRPPEWPGHHQEGWVVTDGGIVNVMPGATWFKTIDDAKKGISALNITKAIVKEEDPATFGRVFWSLMELFRPDDAQQANTDATPTAAPATGAGMFVRMTGDPGKGNALRGPYATVRVEEGQVVAVTPDGADTIVASLDYETDSWFTEAPGQERTYCAQMEITTT